VAENGGMNTGGPEPARRGGNVAGVAGANAEAPVTNPLNASFDGVNE